MSTPRDPNPAPENKRRYERISQAALKRVETKSGLRIIRDRDGNFVTVVREVRS